MTYRVVEVKNGARHEARKYIWDWEAFWVYPRKILGRFNPASSGRSYNIELTDREKDKIRELFQGAGKSEVSSEEMNEGDLREKLERLVENYTKILKSQGMVIEE